jgi:hypothetical protein
MESMRAPQRRQLSPDQEMDLWLGPFIPDAFAGPAERRDAWFRHRDRLMALFARAGRRLMAWWQYEAPIPWPGLERQASALYEAGLLSEAEKAELEAEWRADFDEAQDPDFWICNGPNTILKGAAARVVQYREADIPRALVKRWKAERRRQVKTIRQLETMAAAAGA